MTNDAARRADLDGARNMVDLIPQLLETQSHPQAIEHLRYAVTQILAALQAAPAPEPPHMCRDGHPPVHFSGEGRGIVEGGCPACERDALLAAPRADGALREQCTACALIGATYLDYINDPETGVASRALYYEACEATNHTCGRGA